MTLRAFPKPSEASGRLVLSPKQRREFLNRFCEAQRLFCVTCGCRMTREVGCMNTATLAHRFPEPMGAKKRDNLDNLLGAQCWKCNFERGSKRT